MTNEKNLSGRVKAGKGVSARAQADKQRAERHELYKQMLKEYRGSSWVGFCSMLWWKFNIDASVKGAFKRKLPELYAQKPKRACGYWWPASIDAPRIAALKAAIKASAPKAKATPKKK